MTEPVNDQPPYFQPHLNEPQYVQDLRDELAQLRAQLAAVEAICDDENVPDASYRVGYELALRVVRLAMKHPDAVLNPPVRVAARGEDQE